MATLVSKEWLPYLRAALDYRVGRLTAFDDIPESERSPSKVTDACMRLAAAQRMAVPSADLKPLRQVVDAHVASLEQATDSELYPLASFYWDLMRCGLKYPAMRMHGRKFLTRLRECMDQDRQLAGRLEESQVLEALCWLWPKTDCLRTTVR